MKLHRQRHHGPGVHGPGEHGPGPAGRVPHPLVARTLEVVRIEPLSPRTVRVTLSGDQLAGFRTAAPTDHVRVFFPTGDRAPVLPAVVDGRPRMGGTTDPHRDYTVRRYRPGPSELEIDIVLHDEGVAVAWVANAHPGDRVGVLGPRWSVLVPSDRDWYLFAVDATALPATERWLGELPAGVAATVIAQVADAGEARHLETAADLDLRWLHGDGLTLEDAMRSIDLPPGRGYVWVAGETGAVAPIRGYLQDDLGLTADQCDVDGYWRRGVAGQDHREPQS